MAKIDVEVLFLILTKVAKKEQFYSYDPKQLVTGQLPGTITYRHLSEVYERITSNVATSRFEWSQPLQLLSELLLRCGLPTLAAVVVAEVNQDSKPFRPGNSFWLLPGVPASTPSGNKENVWLEILGKAQATQWPRFGELKKLFRSTK